MHADPCEAALDAPLMYEAGWGKRLSYVFAFGAHEAVDVARRYAVSWPATLLRRAEVKEGWLELTIAALCEARQAALPPPRSSDTTTSEPSSDACAALTSEGGRPVMPSPEQEKGRRARCV